MSDPLRVRAWEALGEGELSANELGARLGVDANRLYYHLRQLEDADLIEVAGVRKAVKGTERLYRVTDRGTGPQLAHGGPDERALFFGSLLEATKADLEAAVFDQQARGRDIRVLRATFTGTNADATAVMNAVAEVLEGVRSRPARRRTRTYRLTVAAYDVPDDGGEG